MFFFSTLNVESILIFRIINVATLKQH